MRLVAFVLAACVLMGGSAAAQWKEYAYITDGFAVAFPADPEVEEVAMYEIVPGKMVPARIYSVRHNNGLFKMTVADARDQVLDENAVLAHAISKMAQGGEVRIDYPHRIYRIYGRQLSIARPDGSLTTAAVFYANERLYQIESTKLAGGSDTDLIMFQQSLTFDRNVRNRTPEQVRAIVAACSRPGGPNNPAGADDPRCAAAE